MPAKTDPEDELIGIRKKRAAKNKKKTSPKARSVRHSTKRKGRKSRFEDSSKKEKRELAAAKRKALQRLAKIKTEAPATVAQQKEQIIEQLEQHNNDSCVRIPKNASLKDLERIYASRPIVRKRPPKLTKAEREAKKVAKELEVEKEKAHFKKKREENAIKQSNRTDDIIARYTKVAQLEEGVEQAEIKLQNAQKKVMKAAKQIVKRHITPQMVQPDPAKKKRRITPTLVTSFQP